MQGEEDSPGHGGEDFGAFYQGRREKDDTLALALAVLHQTVMPALLVEVGFLNTDRDNALFDQRFDQTAGAIAEGILKSL